MVIATREPMKCLEALVKMCETKPTEVQILVWRTVATGSWELDRGTGEWKKGKEGDVKTKVQAVTDGYVWKIGPETDLSYARTPPRAEWRTGHYKNVVMLISEFHDMAI